jgi:hypothetical protein
MTAAHTALLDRFNVQQAPFVRQRLTKDGMSGEDYDRLFPEFLKFAFLTEVARQERPWATLPMLSKQVDQVWHAFILFTAEYAAFCDATLGRFLHHKPNLGGEGHPEDAARFRALYATYFGPVPEVWGKPAPAGDDDDGDCDDCGGGGGGDEDDVVECGFGTDND